MKPVRRSWWLTATGFTDLFFLYAPIAVLIVFSFNASRLSAVWTGWTIDWYRVLASDTALMAALWNSLIVAASSTAAAVGLGVGAAVGLERARFQGQDAVELGLLLPLVIPEVMMGVSLLVFFVLIKLPLGLLSVMIGHTVFNLPLVAAMVRARLRRLDPGLEDAARDLGATPWQAFARVTLPLLRPAIIGAALMAFTVSLDDFIVTFFTAGPGATTLPLKVYSMIKSGVSPEINALSAILVLVSMGMVGLSLAIQRWQESEH
jgi:spermidine/putrescine transport system permease protein